MNTDDNIVLYDTAEKVKQTEPQIEIETFDLVDATHPALHKALPEFDFENAKVVRKERNQSKRKFLE